MNVHFTLPTFTFATTLTALACTASLQAQVVEESDAAGETTTTMLITPPGRVELPNDEVPPMEIVDQPVEDILYRIGELTGKTILPVGNIGSKKFTVITHRPMPRSKALDLIFRALVLNDIGTIEREDVILIGDLDDIAKLRQQPVLTADDDVMMRQDLGSYVAKIFRLENVKVDAVEPILTASLPDNVSIEIDGSSNQLVVYADIAYCQHVQQIVAELDNRFVRPETRTWRLRHADAEAVASNVTDLFESDGSSSGTASRGRTQTRSAGRNNVTTPRVDGGSLGAEIELRITVNVPQNSLTISGEPAVLREVDRLITSEWDLPRDLGTTKLFTLRYTDPVKVAEKLNSLLGQGTGGGGGTARGRSGQQGGSSVEDALSGIYRIESYPETYQLLVFSKTRDSLDFLEHVLESLDQPTSIGLPFVVELKHADAFELAEQLNALLSEPGVQAAITRPEQGLSGQSIDQLANGGTGTDQTGQNAETVTFPWQRGGRGNEEYTPESPLIGKARIVPISRQNALAVLAPRPQEEALRDLITFFDRPGRQVELSVVIAEVELNDELNLGLRMSATGLAIENGDNALALGVNTTNPATKEFDVFGLFDSGTLSAEFSADTVLQALAQVTNVRVMQNPVVFTADNQEAFFFDGSEFPFANQVIANAGTAGGTQSFEYRSVGLVLNARPRITAQKDVDMDIRLELSKIGPAINDGGPTVDRRQTTTNIVVKNGQTIILSGLLKEEERTLTRKVPLLGDIPVFGELFTSRDNTLNRKEIIAFVTPRVVDNPDENDENFQQDYRDRLEEMRAPLAEQREAAETRDDTGRGVGEPTGVRTE